MAVSGKIRSAFDDVAKRKPALYAGNIIGAAGSAWLLEALSMLETTLGEGHPTSRTMRGAVDYVLANEAHGPAFRKHNACAAAAEGAFEAAKQIVDGDRVDGLIDIVRADTEAELLTQADALRLEGPVAAATVIAGGALETHLRGLVDRYAISWQQHGERGISTYNNAIAAYRKKNPSASLYTAATADLISGWAKMRNDAAHEPIAFMKTYSLESVRQMIDGIRLLISGST